MLAAFAHGLVTLLGAASEASGLGRVLKANTVKNEFAISNLKNDDRLSCRFAIASYIESGFRCRLVYDFRWSGGARASAGRKRLPPGLRHTPHRSRPRHRSAHPVHVTMRAALRSLRSQFVAPTVLGPLRASFRPDFRVVHYSIQANHLHLIVEASSAKALSSGMRGLAVRLARRINRLLFRRGRFWADRWHGTALSSPRQVRNALVYVLQNRAKHLAGVRGSAFDPLSSAADFDGFASGRVHKARAGPAIAPRTWLLGVGWRRLGLIRPSEVPAR